MDNKYNFSHSHQNFEDKKKALQMMEWLYNATDGMPNYFLMWNQGDHLIAYDEQIFELYPDSRDIFVVGRTFEDIMRMGFERGYFKPPKKMTAEQWIDRRLELHKQGDYFNVRQIKGRWIQIRDQKTEDGYTITTAIDITHLKKQEKELRKQAKELKKQAKKLKEQAKGLKAAKERADKAESLLRDAVDTMSDGFSLWDKDDRFILSNKKLFELYPNVKDIYVPGHSYEEILRKGIEKGDFTVPDGMTKEAWVKKRAALHKSGDHIHVRYVKGQWLQIRDQRTTQGNVATTAIDVTHLKAQAEKFIQTYGVSKPIEDFKAFKNYRKVTFRGMKFYLGIIQGKIIKQLHEAALAAEDPEDSWVSGQILLDEAGSKSEQVRDVFRHKHGWKEIILSDGHGFFRLNI